MAIHLAEAAGALGAFLLVLIGLSLIGSWIATTKELLWSVLIQPRLTIRVGVGAFAVSLVVAMSCLPNLPALVFTGFITPLLAWPALNLFAWLRSPKGLFKRSLSGLTRGEWSHAFQAREQRRLRDAYTAPTLVDPEDETFDGAGLDRRAHS